MNIATTPISSASANNAANTSAKTNPSVSAPEKTASQGALYKYRKDIDGLRGIAVIAVILFHLNKAWLPGGFTGVDIFFVISGYVVTASILRHRSQGMANYLTSFYKRRVLRLIPALLACLFVTVSVSALFINPDAAAPVFSLGGRALFGWSNNYLIASSSDYFGISTELNPLTHTWSLGVEEQFYLIFPILLALVYGLDRPVRNTRLAVFVLLAAVVVSGALCAHYAQQQPIRAYYFMPSRFWEMAAGALLFAALVAYPQRLEVLFKKTWRLYSVQLSALLLIAISLALTSAVEGFPMPGAIPSVIGTLLFLVAGLSGRSQLNRLCSNSFLTYTGQISYSLYLWHWPTFVFFRWTIGLNTSTQIVAALALTLALSLISYYAIERPLRRLKSLHYRQVFAIALCCILLVGSTGVALAKPLKGKLYLASDYQSQNWWPEKDDVLVKDSHITTERCVRFTTDTTGHAITDKRVETCTSPSQTALGPHLFVLGDSHALASVPMLAEAKARTDMGLTAAMSTGCLVTQTLSRRLDDGQLYTECHHYLESMVTAIKQTARPGDLVYIASRYSPYVADGLPVSAANRLPEQLKKTTLYKGDEAVSKAAARQYISRDLIQLAKALETDGINVVLQAPLPEHRLRTDECLPTWFSANSGLKSECFVSRQENLAYRQATMDIFRSVEAAAANVYVWDGFDQLCSDELCSHFSGGDALFYDQDHLSVKGSQSLTDSFVDFLSRNQLLNASPQPSEEEAITLSSQFL